MAVTKHELEASLEALRAEAAALGLDPRAGLFGPGSLTWRLGRESVLFASGGRAALLQLAHPYVAHAVDQHSATRTDPLGRFVRTFDNVFAMIFGDVESALACARRVHARHRSVRGDVRESVGPFAAGARYDANDEDALVWVHATLLDSALRAYELLIAKLEPDERRAHYEESKRFAALFGIPARALPQTVEDFDAYMARMTGPGSPIEVGRAAREIGQFLLRPPKLWAAPAWRAYGALTAGLLPPRIREGFGLAFGAREKLAYRGALAALRAGRLALPRRARYLPAYLEAQHRLGHHAGEPAPSTLFGRLFELATGTRAPRGYEARPSA